MERGRILVGLIGHFKDLTFILRDWKPLVRFEKRWGMHQCRFNRLTLAAILNMKRKDTSERKRPVRRPWKSGKRGWWLGPWWQP